MVLFISQDTPGRGLKLGLKTWPDPAEFAFFELVHFSTEAAEGSQPEKKVKKLAFLCVKGT